MAEKEVQTTSSKLGAFIEKNRTIFIVLLILVLSFVLGYVITSVILNNSKNKTLEAIDQISFELTDKGMNLSEDEITQRADAALEKLAAYTKKSGIAGARANMLCADITFNQKKYSESFDYWKATATKAKKAYTAPIAYYNMGVCAEQLNKTEDAAENYKLAAGFKDFVLFAHAKYNYGRILETQGKYAEAVETYNQIGDKLPNDVWAKLAKSRVLALKAEGKAE